MSETERYTTAEAARAAGAKFYYSSNPCLRGHVGARYTKGSSCYECHGERQARRELARDTAASGETVSEEEIISAPQPKKKDNPETVAVRLDDRAMLTGRSVAASYGTRYRAMCLIINERNIDKSDEWRAEHVPGLHGFPFPRLPDEELPDFHMSRSAIRATFKRANLVARLLCPLDALEAEMAAEASQPEPEQAKPVEPNNWLAEVPIEFHDVAILCRAFDADIGGKPQLCVDARELHTGLKVGRDFSNWIKGRIADYRFVENEDFCSLSGRAKTGSGGHNAVEFRLSLRMAKELAIVENNEAGHKVRRYYMWAEDTLLSKALLAAREQGHIPITKRQALEIADYVEDAVGRALQKWQPSAALPVPVAPRPWPTGTESFRKFCQHNKDLSEDLFHRWLSTSGVSGNGMGLGLIEQVIGGDGTRRWVCTQRAKDQPAPWVVDIVDQVVIHGEDRPYAHLTPKGISHFTEQLHKMRLNGGSLEQHMQMSFDLNNKHKPKK